MNYKYLYMYISQSTEVNMNGEMFWQQDTIDKASFTKTDIYR